MAPWFWTALAAWLCALGAAVTVYAATSTIPAKGGLIPMTICAICPRPIPIPEPDAERYACRGCEHQLRAWLGQLVSELPLLEAALVPGAGGPGGRPAGRAHAPLPVNVRVLNLLGPGRAPIPEADEPLVSVLARCAHRVAAGHTAVYRSHGTEYQVPCEKAQPRTGSGITAWTAWLTAYLHIAVRQPTVRELHAELADAVARVAAVTGTHPRTHRYLAPCPACLAFAMTRTDGEWEIRCGVCGHRAEPDEYAAHAAEVLPGLGRTMALMVAANAQHSQAS